MVAARIMGAYRAAFSGLGRETWLLSLVGLINRSGSMVLPFLSLYLTQALGFSLVEAGQVLSAYGLGSMVGAQLGGWLSDRLGPLRVMRLSLLCSGAGYLVLSQARSFWAVAAAVAVTSALADALRPAILVAINLSSEPGTRARSLALLRLALNLGVTVGPSMGGLIIARHPLWLFLGNALSAWAAVVVLGLTLGRRAAAPALDPAPAPAPRSPWLDLPFLAFLGLTAVLMTVFMQVLGTMPVYLRDVYRMPEPLIGTVLGLNGACIVLFEMLLVKALERRDSLVTAAFGALLICLGLALMAAGRGLALAYASALVWTLGEMLALPASNTAVGFRAGVAGAGRYMGAYTLTFSLAFLLAPTVGTAIYDRVSPEALWLASGALGPLLFAGFLLLSRSFRSSGREAEPAIAPPGPLDRGHG